MTLPPRPPRLADWLLRRCLPHGAAGESVRGDLYEEFCLREPPGGGRGIGGMPWPLDSGTWQAAGSPGPGVGPRRRTEPRASQDSCLA